MATEGLLPKCFDFLFEPSRYKVLYGGRGSGKSQNVARALLIQAAQKPLRVLCARELQSSIRDSVHRLLADEISALGLDSFYEVQAATIRGANGSEFIFKGLKHNVSEIKSMHGIDRAFVEEAQIVSKSSWDLLIPTIREPNSEIWVVFNPMLEEDETYKRFVLNPPPNTIVRKINWKDNPFFPQVLRDEMEHLKRTDPDAWLNVWEGYCRQTVDGAVYARELRQATEEGRICRVPYDRAYPVSVFFDLGWADSTSLWFAQSIGFEYRLIDYYSDNQRPINDYLQVIQDKHYTIKELYLPHDAKAKQLGTGRSIQEIVSETYSCSIAPNMSLEDGINAVRTIFPQLWFDAERCADGLQALRHYQYEVDPDTKQFSRKPLHSWASHGADALRYLALVMEGRPAIPADRYQRKLRSGAKRRGSPWAA